MAYILPPSARSNYKNIRRVVLDRTRYSPEEQRQRFCNLVLAANDHRFAYAQKLADVARRWLQLEVRSAVAVLEEVVLERFVAGLPAATVTWVRCHRPTSLSAAITLAEDHMVQCPAPPHGKKPEPAPRRKFPPCAASAAVARGPTFSPPNPSPHSRLNDGPSQPTEATSDIRTRVLVVWPAGPLVPRVSAHGGGAGSPGGESAHLRSRF